MYMVIETSGFAHRLTSADTRWFGEERSLTDRDAANKEVSVDRPIAFESRPG